MRIEITRVQDVALNDLRGLPEHAHMLVMCSKSTADGAVLDGSKAAFDELVSFVGEELADGMLHGKEAEALAEMCGLIDPDCIDWLGM